MPDISRTRNIEVELVPMAGGGQIIGALQSGALQFGISLMLLGVLNARNGGIPVTYVSFNFQANLGRPGACGADDGPCGEDRG